MAHQGYNGAVGAILDLSYSWGTTSMWLLHGDQLLAPNAINPTNHTHMYVCAGKSPRTHMHRTGHNFFLASLVRSQIIITQIWFGSRVFWLQFHLLKQSALQSCSELLGHTSFSDWRTVWREGGGGQIQEMLIGNLFNDSFNGDVHSFGGPQTQFPHSAGKKNKIKCERMRQVRHVIWQELNSFALITDITLTLSFWLLTGLLMITLIFGATIAAGGPGWLENLTRNQKHCCCRKSVNVGSCALDSSFHTWWNC